MDDDNHDCDKCGMRLGYVGEGPLCYECMGLEASYEEGFADGQQSLKFNLYQLEAHYVMGPQFNWSRFYSSADFAKEKAEKHFKKKIKWKKRVSGFTSGDLNYISYDIKKVVVKK